MTTKKKKTPGKGGSRKLKLKKETIRDLDAKKASKDVKGGMWGVPATIGCPRPSGNCSLVASICYVAPLSYCPC